MPILRTRTFGAKPGGHSLKWFPRLIDIDDILTRQAPHGSARVVSHIDKPCFGQRLQCLANDVATDTKLFHQLSFDKALTGRDATGLNSRDQLFLDAFEFRHGCASWHMDSDATACHARIMAYIVEQ